MIIPIDNTYKNFKKGDIVIIIKPIYSHYFYVDVNHEFTIINKNNWNDYKLKDNSSDIIINTKSENFTIKIDIESSKYNYIKSKNEKTICDFIVKKCPNKFSDLYDRDYYDACKLIKNKGNNNECKVEMECLKYINKNKISSKILLTLRNLKINNIKNEL